MRLRHRWRSWRFWRRKLRAHERRRCAGGARLSTCLMLLLPACWLRWARDRALARTAGSGNFEIASSRELKIGGADAAGRFCGGAIRLGQRCDSATRADCGQRGGDVLRTVSGKARAGADSSSGRRTRCARHDMGRHARLARHLRGCASGSRPRPPNWQTTGRRRMSWFTTAFPSLPDDQHWMEEGLATYIEPIARVETGELKAEKNLARHGARYAQGRAAGGRSRNGSNAYVGTDLLGRGAVLPGGRRGDSPGDPATTRDCRMRCGRLWRRAGRSIMSGAWTGAGDWRRGDGNAGADRAVCEVEGLRRSPVDLEKLWGELGIKRDGDGVQFVAGPLADVRKAIAKESAGRQQAGAIRLP